MKYIYLHGLGQTADSWNQIAGEGDICLDLPGLLQGQQATYLNLYRAVSQKCDAEPDNLVLCGLSLGAVLALNYAIDRPQKVKALVLIAAQYKMPTALLKLQNFLFRLMPSSMFQGTGFGKADFISLCGTMGKLNFQPAQTAISCPILIVCGQKDRANQKAAKELTQLLKNAQFVQIPGAGHEVNQEAPAKLSAALQAFYKGIR